MIQPETSYARVGEDRVAYQVLGAGPPDLVYTAGLWGHLDVQWEEPAQARFLRRLSGFSRLIRFDRRGTGVSDPLPDDGTSIPAHWSRDLLAVLDATGAQAPVMVGTVDSGPLLLEFLARHPGRCSRLVLANTTACLRRQPDYPQGLAQKNLDDLLEFFEKSWGREEFAAAFMPSQAHNPSVLRWFSKYQRAMASPRTMVENLKLIQDFDARRVLPGIKVPTLVIARSDLRIFPASQSRYIADHIPEARYVELPGADGNLAWEGADRILGLIEEFVTGSRRSAAPERALATVLFTDIVDSTRLAAKHGDAAWRALLDRHDQAVREELARYGGRLVDSAGDGTLATFPTPGSAIDCAHALVAAMKELKLKIRCGLHIGELELREDGRVGGVAVHIGARVLGEAKPGDVLVSRTVRDVLIGSPYRFKDRGIRELKGVPSKWPLYVVESPKR
jgi:class 3 adenylate cyclase